MRDRGVLFHPAPFENLFVSMAHTSEDVAERSRRRRGRWARCDRTRRVRRAGPGHVGAEGRRRGIDGTSLATASAGYPTARPLPGRAEQDPADWFSAIVDVIAALTTAVPHTRWGGLGLSAMIRRSCWKTPTVPPSARRSRGRTTAQIRTANGSAPRPATRRSTGRPASGSTAATCSRWCVGSHAKPRRASNGPPASSARRTDLFSRLTGEAVTDPSTATGFGCYSVATGSWDGTLAADATPKLPRVEEPSFSRGLRADVAAALGLPAGMPVVLGAADSVCGALGAAASSPGDRVSLWGTSTAIIGVSAELVLDTAHRYLVTPLARGEGWGLEMDLVSTGSAVGWLAGMVGVSEADLFALAATSGSARTACRSSPTSGSVNKVRCGTRRSAERSAGSRWRTRGRMWRVRCWRGSRWRSGDACASSTTPA